MLLVLRFSHVFFGALWVGMMAFQTFFLMPALAEVGPESGKFMAALMRRRLPVILPIVALITLVSGFWLFQRVSGGAPAGLMRTPMGLAFGSGGLAALLAFLLGIVVMRPAMMQSTALQQSLASASPEERATRSAEIQRLRARGASEGFDYVIAGAGHNSLVCAAYLARAGNRVLVLEGSAMIGGGVKTAEVLLPGYKTDGINQNPMIRDNEIPLRDYGYETIEPDVVVHILVLLGT